MADQKQPQDFAITITEDHADNASEKGAPSTAKPSQHRHLSRGVLPRLSDFIQEWTPFLLVVSYFVFSTCLYMVCTDALITIFWFIYLATNFYIAGSTVLEAFMSITPCKEARKDVEKLQQNKFVFPTPDDKLPILDLLIVAYLPNEKDIIMGRVFYALERIVYPKERIRINVLYNTPKRIEPLETELHNLTLQYSHLRVTKVPNSSSKADNLNHYFTLVTGADLIAIFDCDHYSHPHGPRWAAERFCLDATVDIVQGRCIVFNSSASFLAGMISVEFDKIYAVSHPGRAAMWGFGVFCGSNGYWRASLLRELKMDGDMLTEDIDSALRAVSRGANTVHELNAVSYELAPTTLPAFWKQRLRWAQGWAQASTKHLRLSYQKSPEGYNRNFSVRFGLFSLLLIREWSYYLVTQVHSALFVISKRLLTQFSTLAWWLASFSLNFQRPHSIWHGWSTSSIRCLSGYSSLGQSESSFS